MRFEPPCPAPRIPRLRLVSEQLAELPVLRSACPAAVHFAPGSVGMSVLLFQLVPSLRGRSVFYFRTKCLQFVKTSKKCVLYFEYYASLVTRFRIMLNLPPVETLERHLRSSGFWWLGRALSKRLKTGERRGWRHWTCTVAGRRHFLLLHQLHPDGSPSFWKKKKIISCIVIIIFGCAGSLLLWAGFL